MSRPWKLLLAAAMVLPAALACSSTLYSSAGGTSGALSYDPTSGIAFGFPAETLLLAVAFPFQPYRTAEFRGVRLALSCGAGPCEFTLELRRDAGGLPGSVIESFLTYAGLGMVRSRTHSMLFPDETYWLAVSEAFGHGGIWHSLSAPEWEPAPVAEAAWRDVVAGSGWQTDREFPPAAFIVTGVPEPSMFWLMLAALLAGVTRCPCGAQGRS